MRARASQAAGPTTLSSNDGCEGSARRASLPRALSLPTMHRHHPLTASLTSTLLARQLSGREGKRRRGVQARPRSLNWLRFSLTLSPLPITASAAPRPYMASSFSCDPADGGGVVAVNPGGVATPAFCAKYNQVRERVEFPDARRFGKIGRTVCLSRGAPSRPHRAVTFPSFHTALL